MADYQEEVYIVERKEISDDEGDDYEFERMIREAEATQKDEGDLDELEGDDAGADSEDDLNDFNALKNHTEQRAAVKRAQDGGMKPGTAAVTLGGMESTIPGTVASNVQAKTVEREVVIDDFIRNFLTAMNMKKTMNIFQNEWFELQKKGTFQDLGIGLITDIKNKNARMEAKLERMKVELTQAKVVAESAKSTWEKLRKERDFHKQHQDRVNGEKIVISNNIKAIKNQHEDFAERIDEMNKKLLATVKEKALIKLEKDKLSRKAFDLQGDIKRQEEKVQRQINATHKRALADAKYSQHDGLDGSTIGKGTKMTPYPEDARPNPFLSRDYEPIHARLQNMGRVEAHSKGIGGMALHMRKQILATASDDCLWKIWNMETNENIMTGEGHKEWLSGIDFHPAGSHLVTSGSDRCVKVWDFMSSSIAHTFVNVSTSPIWKARFHDTGDFVLTADGSGAVKLFDLHSVKLRQQYRSHTDSVNGLAFQPFTNFFVTGSSDRTLSIWDMRTGLTVQTFYGHLNSINDCQFSIGGQYISSVDADGVVKVWDIRMVQEVATTDMGDCAALCCQFDKSGKMLAVGCSDGEIRLLNMEKGCEVQAQFKAHDQSSVNSIIINQENNVMYTAGGDGIIKSWQ